MSMSKTYRAALILRAIDDGRFRLDTRDADLLRWQPRTTRPHNSPKTHFNVVFHWSGKRAALPPPAPLGTGLETFASSGSSRYEAPCKRSRPHDDFALPLRYGLAAS